MNIIIKLLPLLFLICCQAKPIEDSAEAVEILPNEDENDVDGGGETIDISSLGPEAYGKPNNESGE